MKSIPSTSRGYVVRDRASKFWLCMLNNRYNGSYFHNKATISCKQST